MRQPSLVPVILAGGMGTRLWPLSRRDNPKAFQKLTSLRPMLVETLMRLPEAISGVDLSAPVVVANETHAALVRGAMMVSDDSDGWVIVEPEGKDTAPAAAMAAHFALEQEREDALILVLPADQEIGNVGAFHAGLQEAVGRALEDNLVRLMDKDRGDTGIFVVRATRFLSELETHRRQMAQMCRAAWKGRYKAGNRVIGPDPEAWNTLDAESVNTAIFQQTDQSISLEVKMDWSDIEDFAALSEHIEPDTLDNRIQGRAVLEQSQGNLVVSEGARTVTLLGCEDMVVIDTPDAVLVVPKSKAGDVKTLHAHLKAIGRDDLL
ncbi:MAG: sugar phosphate nucleotidyltransferase [Pseudomonadota bacterium]